MIDGIEGEEMVWLFESGWEYDRTLFCMHGTGDWGFEGGGMG